MKYFHVFGSVFYILVDMDPRRKFDPKSDEGIFLGYSRNSRAYRVFNKRTKTMMESMNVVVNDDHDVTNSTNDEDEVFPSNIDVRTDAENSLDDISSGNPNVRTGADDKVSDIIPDEGVVNGAHKKSCNLYIAHLM